MLHLKSYLGSIVLAGLLLQGCGSSTDESTTNTPQTSAEVNKAENTINAINEAFAGLNATSSDEDIAKATRNAKLLASKSETTTVNAAQTAGVFSGVTDKIKDGLVKVMDSSVGNKVSSAAFDVVLNSEGVTVVMLDLARKSHTTTKIMIDALDADWSLTKKMIPMLQTNKEFGEKFAALAYEEPDMARFFFSRVDAPMYNALADAMLLSNDDNKHDSSVEHSTNAYMGILMGMYATEYFVPFGSGSTKTTIGDVKYAKNDAAGNLATDDNFVNLLADTKAVVTYDGNITFTGHGDGNEIINEKFFYSLFKTPGSTDSFVNAMDKLPQSTVTELMDNIFLGKLDDKNDTVQGYLNIISIGSAMYDGIYGQKNIETGTRENAYGFSSYAGAFVGFAGLIQGDRYMTYGKAFVNAGYEYAQFHGINVWSGVSEAAKTVWNSYTNEGTSSTAADAPTRSAGLGLVKSDWVGDVTDLLLSAYTNLDLTISWVDLYKAIADSDKSIITEITKQIDGVKDSGNKAYHTLLDGRNEDNITAYPTKITNSLFTANDEVYGFHGLLELAIREDMVNSGLSSDMTEAEGNFSLPLFADITWSYAYGTAKDGAMTYVKGIDADWIANLNSNDLIRTYFYPSADNIYIPSWMLAIDWLTIPANYTGSGIEDYDFAIDFNSGYLDIYVVSTNPALLTDINLPQAVGSIKTIEMVKVEMGSDSIIAVDEAGLNLAGLNVYKITVISAADAEKVLAYLGGLGDSALSAIGLDSSNTANVDTTTAE